MEINTQLLTVPALAIDSIVSNETTLNCKISEFSAGVCGCCQPRPMVVDNNNLTLLPNSFNKFSTDKAGFLNVFYTWNNRYGRLLGGAIMAVFFSIMFIIIGAVANAGVIACVVIPWLCFGLCYWKTSTNLYNVFIVINHQYLMVYRGKPGDRIRDLKGEAYDFTAVPIILEKYFRHWTTRSNDRTRHHNAYFISFRISGHAPSGFAGQELFHMRRDVHSRFAPPPYDIEQKFNELKSFQASNMFGFPLLLVSDFNCHDNIRRTRLYERYIVKPLQQGNLGAITIEGLQLNPNLNIPQQPVNNNMQQNIGQMPSAPVVQNYQQPQMMQNNQYQGQQPQTQNQYM